MNAISKATISFITNQWTKKILWYKLCPIIFLFSILAIACNEDSGIYSSQDTSQISSTKLTSRTIDLYTVYAPEDTDPDVSHPNSYTTILTFDGNFQWSDNSDPGVTWNDGTDIKVTVFCTCTSLLGYCMATVPAEGEYGCQTFSGCLACRLSVTVECEAQQPVEVPNGITIRRDI